jgi:hypothetical protein
MHIRGVKTDTPHVVVGDYQSLVDIEECPSAFDRYSHAMGDLLRTFEALERSGYFAPFKVVVFPAEGPGFSGAV